MEQLYIICVDDQREVLDALSQDLEVFETKIHLEECESVAEANDLLENIYAQGDLVAIVITDQVMPANTGVELLTSIKQDDRFSDTKKILLTGQATHKDTIQAINQGNLDYYIEKPWSKEELQRQIRILLTHFILERDIDYQGLSDILDAATLLEFFKKRQ